VCGDNIPDNLKFITPDMQTSAMPDLSTIEGQAEIEKHLDGVKLVILDNLSCLIRTGKENEGESWLPVQDFILRLRRMGISVLLVHHAGKGGLQRGTSRREDLLDSVIMLRHPGGYSPSDGLRCEVHYEKARGFFGEDAKEFEVRMEVQNDSALWLAGDLDNGLLKRAAQLYQAGLTVRDVAEELGISRSRAGRLRQHVGEQAAEIVPVSQSQPGGTKGQAPSQIPLTGSD
jgi:putative DNA primase/helicase